MKTPQNFREHAQVLDGLHRLHRLLVAERLLSVLDVPLLLSAPAEVHVGLILDDVHLPRPLVNIPVARVRHFVQHLQEDRPHAKEENIPEGLIDFLRAGFFLGFPLLSRVVQGRGYGPLIARRVGLEEEHVFAVEVGDGHCVF